MTGITSQLTDLQVVVCAGAGGVGKTTVSATIALGLAAEGHRVALVTIDPARRLAEALGFEDLGNQPQRVDPRRLARAGIQVQGELSAMMLDVKRTFDELIELLAPDRRTLEQILANPIYKQISTAVGGSQEYTAMAKLLEIDHSGAYDVVVLDTPPSRSAVDFLLAPQRLNAFLEGRAMSLFLRPTGALIRMAGLVSAALRRIVGVGMLEDLTGFFRLLSGLLEGFRERAVDVEALLGAPTTGFLIVSSPERAPVEEAISLASELDRLGMRRQGLIINRVHPVDPEAFDSDDTANRLTPQLGSGLAHRVATEHGRVQRMALWQETSLRRLEQALGEPRPFRLRDRGADVHDVPGLVALHRELS